MNPLRIVSLLTSLTGFGVPFFLCRAETLQTQRFTSLSANWNLISFQVIPTNPSPAAVFGSLPGFQVAWTFDASTNSWRRFVRTGDPVRDSVENSLPSVAITSIAVGKAYWVYLSAAPGSWNITGTAPADENFPELNFAPDAWNLIGIPVGDADLAGNNYLNPGETINLLSVLTRAGFDYSHILRWEQNTQTFQKATPSNADQDDFSLFDQWRGYFLFVTDPEILRPVLLPAVRADVDAEPIGNFGALPSSHEDLHISNSRTPLDGNTQTHIAFFPGEDVQKLGLSNTGGGIMIWEAEWIPERTFKPLGSRPEDPAQPITAEDPWMTLASDPTMKTDFVTVVDPAGEPQRKSESQREWTKLRGVTTLENDSVYLRLDRKHLAAGTYQGTLQLRTSVGTRNWTVTAEVPGLQGDWRGRASIDTVNGKKNRPPDVDLQVSLFEDADSPGLVRGMVDSTQALLWPVDAPLIGHITDSKGNAFSLGGGYVLPPGDQNIPPYDSITGDLTAEDVDWNNDRKLDNLSPFPFPIHREVLMQGRLVAASSFEGYAIEGEYIEVVSGMLRQSIRVLGTFTLSRESATPFSRRFSATAPIVNNPGIGESNNEPVIKRTFRPGTPVALPVTRTVEFTTDLALTGLQINVRLDTTGMNPGTLVMKLVAPNGTELLLHNLENLPLSTLANITYPSNRSPASSLDTFIRSVDATTTKGTWSLVCSGTGLGSSKLNEFTLTLIGQPVYDVKGSVVSGNLGFPNVGVLLSGLPISASATTDGDGKFTFARLPGIPLNFTINQPGYESVDPTRPGLGKTFTVPGFTATPGNAEEDRLVKKFKPLPAVPVSQLGVAGFSHGTTAAPYVIRVASSNGPVRVSPGPLVVGYSGRDPLEVTFSAIGPVSEPVTWQFNRMTDQAPIPQNADEIVVDTQTGAGRTIAHSFTEPGSYKVSYTHAGEDQPAFVRVLVLPSPGYSTTATNFFHVHPTSGGSLPSDRVTPQTPALSPLKVDLVTIQHTYAASFDLDLAPFTLPANRAYALDGFDPGGAGSFTADPRNRSGNFKDEDHNYALDSAIWIETRDLAGNKIYPDGKVWKDPVSGEDLAELASYAQDDQTFHPHPKVPNNAGIKTTHYRMACNIGAAIQPAPPSVDLPSYGSGIARNREFQLVTGPLAVYAAP